jgi:hypothetical protein
MKQSAKAARAAAVSIAEGKTAEVLIADQPDAANAPIFHPRALWSLEDIARYSQFSKSLLSGSVVCLPDFPSAIRVTETSHPRWLAGEVWEFFESKKRR